MNRKIRLSVVLAALLVVMAGLLSACSTSTGPSDAYKGETPEQIYTKGKIALQDKNYAEAIKRFEALDVQYPYSANNESGQLYLIYAYYMKEEYIMASSTADRFIQLHPVNPHVDYAYYLRGASTYYQNMGILEKLSLVDISSRDMSQIKKSYQDFNELIVRFPNSEYTPAGYQYMVYLRNLIAKHELDTGKYYYNRKAYAAAANRAGGVVAHFQGTPSVVPALVLMAKSYHELGLTKLEQDAVTLLHYNYPNTPIDYGQPYRD